MSALYPQSLTPAYSEDSLAQRNFITRVYGWMTLGLVVTTLVAALVSQAKPFLAVLQQNMGPILIVMVLAQLGIAIGLGAFINRIPALLATLLFLAYSAITGVFFSFYFLIFTGESLMSTFLVTALMFGGMSVFGMVTKKDLTSIGSFCMMGVWGLLIASLVNLFFHSPAIYWLSTYIGIGIFIGLTAYDTQKIKYMYMAGADGSATQQKAAILAAFRLYLDFVILFQYLLRLLGRRK